MESFAHVSVLFAFLEALEGPLGAIGVDLGAIWAAFWGHFGDFFRIRGIFKNISFTKVKRYFLRFGRVLDRDFFVYLLQNFEDLLALRVSIGIQMGLFGGPLVPN